MWRRESGSGLTLLSNRFGSASHLTLLVPVSASPTCFLFDNGSLRAAATKSLRAVALALEAKLGVSVEPVSLLHSSGVDAAELEGRKAKLLEPALDDFWSRGGGEPVLLPLFFGPSAALTEYVPARLDALRARHPTKGAWLADPLVNPSGRDDRRVARALAAAVRAVVRERGLARPGVVLVDHGTPQKAVTAVREHLGVQLREELAGQAAAVGTASMERREGPDYAFNEPLLARALRASPFDAGDVVVALQFLSPGRHAGPGGDVAAICAEAEAERPGLRTYMTEPLGAHPALIDVLADRYAEAVRRGSSAR
jgi:sirohydrochlorin ferrochelatase